MVKQISPAFSKAVRKLLALTSRPKHTVDPDENLLLGAEPILKYLRLSTLGSLNFWVEHFAFPAIKRPDNGMWMSTVTAIDHWLFMMAAAEARKRQDLGMLKSEEHKDRFVRFRERQKAHHAAKQGKEQVSEHAEDSQDTTAS